MVDYIGIIIYTVICTAIIFFSAWFFEEVYNAVKRKIKRHKEKKHYQAEYRKALENERKKEWFERLQNECDT